MDASQKIAIKFDCFLTIGIYSCGFIKSQVIHNVLLQFHHVKEGILKALQTHGFVLLTEFFTLCC